MIIRQATVDDAPAITEIANAIIRDTLVTFTTDERSVEKVTAEIETRGHIAHGSMPFDGDCAVRHMGAVMERMERDLYPLLASKRTSMPVALSLVLSPQRSAAPGLLSPLAGFR